VPRICGNTYETVKKYLIKPLERKITRVEEIGVSIGYQCIDVDYVLWMPRATDTLIAEYLKYTDIAEFTSYLVLYGISDKANWKMPARGAYETQDFNTGVLLLNSLVYKCGGGWLMFAPGYYKPGEKSIFVWTKGYYYYIGA
jgi:hypothetical protein